MIWNKEDIKKAVFEYKGLRHIEILHRGKEYTVEIIAFSVGKGNCTTEIWIVGKNDKIKVVVEIIDKQVTDQECLNIISNNLDDWVYDYESLVRRSIM